MQSQDQPTNLPAQIAEAVSSVPKALVPSSIKALDRLIGAFVDIPVAWLNQKKAKIDSQTQSFALVEGAIATVAANEAAGDLDSVQRALNVLVRKEYRKQVNREAVAVAMIDDLRNQPGNEPVDLPDSDCEIDDDWLNVFERYAEDASTERMQKLWARVLSGEIRKKGKYSMRTLRFLSEFSQGDALNFADFCNSVFGDIAPTKLIKPDDKKDIRNLIYMEAAGLIQGASGLGLSFSITLSDQGAGSLKEGNLAILFRGEPNTKIEANVSALTPLGQELLSLLPTRDARAAARNVANSLRVPAIESAYICKVAGDGVVPFEILWQSAEAIT